MRVKTTPNRKSTARPWPTGSMLRMVADLDSGTKIAVRMIAAAQIGRLIQNTDRQPIVLDEQTADDRAERHRDADHRAPDAERAGPFDPADEDLRNDRQRNRIQHRAADALQEARADQHLDAGRQAAQQRAEREDRQADLEDAPRPKRSPVAPDEHQQRRQHQRVDVDDPLQLGRRGAEVGADGRESRR